jgi:Fic family protein
MVGDEENFAKSFEFISIDIKNFIDDINYVKKLTLADICEFHCRFEKIHPFQDGNGRIGRLIMLRQCLQTNIIPFFINSDTREEYINCMKLYHRTELSSFLTEYCLKQQKIFIQNYSEYLNVNLNDNEQKIIKFLSSKKFANAKEIGNILNLKKTATLQNINNLITKNIIEKNMSGKNSVYSLRNKK